MQNSHNVCILSAANSSLREIATIKALPHIDCVNPLCIVSNVFQLDT